ncbi:centrosomal protein CEP57L1 isoform X2 [Archocentrus centrarchus]|uniref:centrosomal protein CEP57L1 isoform X2 n=1 Tax=Archocentrus centrarchus TaxID=63155 RepID=UPI0011EA4A48|nr:centrosomal protein CEP57L1 isoform X2 [Archocentrus centrarchus]
MVHAVSCLSTPASLSAVLTSHLISCELLDSPSKNSYIGSYYQPPDRILQPSRELEPPAHSSVSMGTQMASGPVSQSRPNIDSKAVVDALKTLQEKIRRLELERTQAEKSYQQFSHDAQKHQQVITSHSQAAGSLPGTDNSARRELGSKLQSAEARCKVLEKQLDYMRKMVENAKKERNALMENQASLQNEQTSSSNSQIQREKLEKLESECLKLSRTQTLAEMKLAILEQKLLKEEHERKLVQEKAELQREFDVSLRPSLPTTEEPKPKKKTKKAIRKNSKPTELRSNRPVHKKLPFVAGTSTSPSHSVHANVQSILHMMKHHQPQLCERVSALHRSGCGAKKNLQKDFASSSSDSSQKPNGQPVEQSLSSLSDLLLALQDELGQMSFEHQELVRQIDEAQHPEQRQDLQSELERLVTRMEDKGSQITKLRKHQKMIHKLNQCQSSPEERTSKKLSGIKPPAPSPVKTKQKGKTDLTTQNNLQLLRETQKFRNSLKQDDLSWET